jgi:hypothetical protein
MATLDAHLICLERNTGEEIWDIPITISGEDGKEAATSTKWLKRDRRPARDQGKVIPHQRAEYGIRGFLDAYDARTGSGLRFYTVPARTRSEYGRKCWPPGKTALG